MSSSFNQTPTNASGTFPSSAAVTVLPATTSRSLLIIHNPGAANPIYVNFGGDATAGAGSIYLGANGGSITFSAPGLVPNGIVSLIGTSGQPYTVKWCN